MITRVFADAVAQLSGGCEESAGPEPHVHAAAVLPSGGQSVRLTLTPKWLRMARCVAFLVDRAAAGPGPDAADREVRHA